MSKQKRKKTEDRVVFWIVRESQCAECGVELPKGAFLTKEGETVICLECADLDHLEYLPRGDAALTRRASKYSPLRAVVVRFSSTRKRYERQGVLVAEEALERAEEECLADAEAREQRRLREAERREVVDAEYTKDFARHVRARYPGCPAGAEAAIAQHACRKYSHRVGRSAAAKEFEVQAIDLAVRAHVRHCHTRYDELLGEGSARHDARSEVAGDVDEVLRKWRAPHHPPSSLDS